LMPLVLAATQGIVRKHRSEAQVETEAEVGTASEPPPLEF